MKTNQDELVDQITLCDALDRMLNKGVVINGDLTVSVAGVELLYIGLRGLICAIDAMETRPASLCSFKRVVDPISNVAANPEACASVSGGNEHGF